MINFTLRRSGILMANMRFTVPIEKDLVERVAKRFNISLESAWKKIHAVYEPRVHDIDWFRLYDNEGELGLAHIDDIDNEEYQNKLI